MATHEDMVTTPKPSSASKPSAEATHHDEHFAEALSADPFKMFHKRVEDFLAKPARTPIQEYLRINAAASIIKELAGEGRKPSPTPSPTPTPTPPATGKGKERRAAACIVGCMVDSRFNTSDKNKVAQAAVLGYLAEHHRKYLEKVGAVFSARRDARIEVAPLVQAIIENVEDKEGKKFDELMAACNVGD